MIPNARKFVREIALNNFVVSIRAVDIPLRDLAGQSTAMKEKLIQLGKLTVEKEEAEVIVIRGVSRVPNHCSAEEIAREVGVPVIDCVAAAIKAAESMVAMGLKNSRKAYPQP